MFQGFSDKTIEFMWHIRFNNERSWFEAHKDDYKMVLEQPMRSLARETYDRFSANHEDLNLQLHISRIYRDARRLHGHGPYKDHLWFTFRHDREQWTDKPVFWFELAPESWSYGLGYYRARPLTMAKHRARIDHDPQPLARLDRALICQGTFELAGADYARPKCDSDRPLASWYNKKTFSLVHTEKISDAVLSRGLPECLIHGFEFLVPFYQYFVTLDKDSDPFNQWEKG